MLRLFRILATGVLGAAVLLSAVPATAARKKQSNLPPQETGFLNRKLSFKGRSFRFQVYLPEEWRHDDGKQWPVILFLHGREERGSDGLWQTQIGLPEAVRNHPERWPFILVLPQCPQGRYWTDPEISAMAMASLDQELREFNADPKRVYLSGISMGGYGAWELARLHPKRWAAMTIAAGGIFWSYATERWQQQATLPREYAKAIGNLPIWLFHGSDDPLVAPRQSELMFEVFKANGGRLRLWLYQGVKHESWERAFNEPDLPKWLLSHRLDTRAESLSQNERISVPLHPPIAKLTLPQIDVLLGDYGIAGSGWFTILSRQGDRFFLKDSRGVVDEVAPESPTLFFYPNGVSPFSRLVFERDSQGRVTGALFHGERREEHWEKRSGKP